MAKWRALSAVILSFCVLWGSSAAAQPLGSFQWQQQPYCNVITVNVVQVGAIYQLDGTDNQCGVARLAAVTGLGFVNPNGTIGLGLTVVTNDGGGNGGAALHLDVILDLSASGTWRDNTGVSGPFVLLVGAPAAGSARPPPVPAFSGGLAAGGARITNVGTPSASTDAVNKAYVDTNVRAALVGDKVWKGTVGPSGSKGSTGPFTASKTGTGRYTVEVDVTGLALPPPVTPLGVVSTYTFAAHQAYVNGYGYSSAGGFATKILLFVVTTDAAGTATDSGFMFMMSLPDANTGSPVPPFIPAASTPDVSCTTTGVVTTCVRMAPG